MDQKRSEQCASVPLIWKILVIHLLLNTLFPFPVLYRGSTHFWEVHVYIMEVFCIYLRIFCLPCVIFQVALNAPSICFPSILLRCLTMSYWPFTTFMKWHVCPQFNPSALIWSVCLLAKALKKQIQKVKIVHHLLFGIDGRCWVWEHIKKKKIKKIIMRTQKGNACVCTVPENTERGRLDLSKFVPSAFMLCLWNLEKIITRKYWGKCWVGNWGMF